MRRATSYCHAQSYISLAQCSLTQLLGVQARSDQFWFVYQRAQCMQATLLAIYFGVSTHGQLLWANYMLLIHAFTGGKTMCYLYAPLLMGKLHAALYTGLLICKQHAPGDMKRRRFVPAGASSKEAA